MSDLAAWAARKLVEAERATCVICALKDLVGLHVLTGVDRGEEMLPGQYDEQQTSTGILRFVLDGVTFRVVEDPSDGYRSSMREIGISLDHVKNSFAPVKVYCTYHGNGRYGNASDLLEMLNVANDKPVLRVGTDNSDDYYPSFISEFTPENIS